MTRLLVNKNELEASLCRESFFDFVKRFWNVIIPETPYFNWHIEYLCSELQILAERVFRREPKQYDLIINISPGTTKSTICSVMFPAWCWTRDATIRLICGSYAFPLSLYLGTQSRDVLLSDKFLSLYGAGMQLTEMQKGLQMNDKGGQRIATSTGGSITGMHGHFLVIDDPINPKQAVSKVALKSANDWIDHTLMTRKVDKRITPFILIMQRLHQNDPTGHLLDNRQEGDIRHICLPAELTNNVKPRRLRHFYVDGLMDTVRLSRPILEASKRELGEYGYAGQFMQSPIPAGGAMFRTDRIEVVAATVRGKKSIRYWDKAGTAGGGAFTVGVLMSVDTQGCYWILDVIRGQWEASSRENIIRQTAEIDGEDVIVAVEQEPGSGGKESAQNTVKRLAGFRVRIDRPFGDKELRADPFAVQVNGGNVKLAKGVWNKEYLDELQYFPFSTYKDQVDASSGAFAMLTKLPRKVGALR